MSSSIQGAKIGTLPTQPRPEITGSGHASTTISPLRIYHAKELLLMDTPLHQIPWKSASERDGQTRD